MGGSPSKVIENPTSDVWLGGINVIDKESTEYKSCYTLSKHGNEVENETLGWEIFCKKENIHCVVSVCQDTPPEVVINDILKGNILHISLEDVSETNLLKHFEASALFIHKNRLEGKNIYIHCHAGISRSTTILAAYLMAHLKFGMLDVLGHLQRLRETICPNGGFRKQLLEFEDTKGYLKLNDILAKTNNNNNNNNNNNDNAILATNDMKFIVAIMKQFQEKQNSSKLKKDAFGHTGEYRRVDNLDRYCKTKVDDHYECNDGNFLCIHGHDVLEFDHWSCCGVAKRNGTCTNGSMDGGWGKFKFNEQVERLKMRFINTKDEEDAGLKWLN